MAVRLARPALLLLGLTAVVVSGCKRQYVLAKYGSRTGVSRSDSGYINARPEPHRGADIHVHYKGDPVIAAADGVVYHIRFDDCAGYTVSIGHPRFNRYTQYAHLDKPLVRLGQVVKRGQRIGRVGMFPCSERVPHVHFELCTNTGCTGPGVLGGTVDPMKHSAGCYRKGRRYRSDRLVLTLPVVCD